MLRRCWRLFALVGAGTIACQAREGGARQSADERFDALNAAEIRRAVAAVRADPSATRARIVSVALDEPDKAAVVREQATVRRAHVVTYDAAGDVLREFFVTLPAGRIASARRVPNAQPMLMSSDAALADSVVQADPRWAAALSKRGFRDLSKVVASSWSAGYFGDSTERGRIVRVVPYVRDRPTDREYLRPIEGLVAVVNLTRRQVTRLDDSAGAPAAAPRPVQAEPGYRAKPATSANRDDGIRVDGQSVAWRQWRLHVAPDLREGAVLHRVRYLQDTRERLILYRASVSEMVVPYGDPDRGWFFRNALDEGELGLGQFVQPLREGLDVPSGAHFLTATIANEQGVPIEHPRAIAIYERDGGLAWKHLDLARRARELVIEWIASLGNYEYGFAWILHEDGTIEQRTSLTGIMSVKGAALGAPGTKPALDAHGERVTAELVAPHHQHFFAFRLDTDIDGASHQRVLEVEGHPSTTPSTTDPHSAMTASTVLLATERGAMRVANANASRRWVVQNTSVRNALGAPVGFALAPGENARPLADTAAWIRKRAGFLNAQLWVTPYRQNERFAAGDFPNQSRGGDGLPAFTRANVSVVDTDVVLWYVMGVTHLPRPEDWPIMPSHVTGFKLVPTGFFSANPLMQR